MLIITFIVILLLINHFMFYVKLKDAANQLNVSLQHLINYISLQYNANLEDKLRYMLTSEVKLP